MYRKYGKRFLDILISLTALTVLAVPMLIVALIVKLESKGPAIFKQERLGRDGKVFMLYKFRSMCENAEYTGSGVYSAKGDPRVTKIGRVLRATSIDELPQFINILKGERGIIETTKKNADFSRVVTVNSISL